ncbi:uncharacterized protein LOC135219812 isoform X2 [Macrobrachium nipponense]|uniref:uncharacterized protein LOC135219812 isoform X2 n=1 Tax=Macrobrachium nipponense TaxID=159736 RepID=UPI0030C88226
MFFQMYEESCNSIAVLLQNLQDTPVVPATNHRTLFCVEDDLPDLPDYDNIVVLQSLASFQKGNYEVIVTTLDQLGKNGEYSNYYRDSSNIKMAHICAATFRFVKSEALLKLGKTEESLVECIRLEGDLYWVMGITSSAWEICILILKTLVYSLLSMLHEQKKNTKSHRHYKRLAAQNMLVLPQRMDLPLWEELSVSDKLLMESIYFFLDDKLKGS